MRVFRSNLSQAAALDAQLDAQEAKRRARREAKEAGEDEPDLTEPTIEPGWKKNKAKAKEAAAGGAAGLPEGWSVVDSVSRPGKKTYVNNLTGMRQAWPPTEPADWPKAPGQARQSFLREHCCADFYRIEPAASPRAAVVFRTAREQKIAV